MNKWSKQEEQVLLDAINANSTYDAAFKEASSKLGRTERACRYKWYGYLKPNNKPKSKKGNNWTPEQDKILSEQIELCDTRREAFEEAAKLTGRSVASCAQRWYNHLSVKKKTFFATVSKKSSIKNRTRPSRKVPATPRDENWWKKILKLLGI